MLVTSEGIFDNLEELQNSVTRRMALLLAGLGGLFAWLTMPQGLPPVKVNLAFMLAVECFAWGALILVLQGKSTRLARGVLVLALILGPLQAMCLTDAPWVPFSSILVIFPSAMVLLHSDFLTAGLIALVTLLFTHVGLRDYPIPALMAALATGVILARLTLYNLYTALQWTWAMQEQARLHLTESRTNRAALKRTLRSLEAAYDVQKRARQELVVAKQIAEEARRMKERFAANISHELRTPLNIVLGFSEIMHLSPDVYGDLKWPPKLRRDIQEIYNSSRHLLQMIDDILDLSRFQMSEFSLNLEPTPLAPLLEETLDIVATLFHGHTVRLEADFPDDLPVLEIDRTRIRQVLLNLLNNARRFTDAGRVVLQACPTGPDVVIRIIDEGCGIPADKLPNLFTEFYQVDSTLNRKRSGTGLGLSISKHFVEAHGGRIWVESVEGRGSVFSFSLPVTTHVPILASYPAPPPPRTNGSSDHKPSVLVVESDPGLISSLRRSLDGYIVEAAPALAADPSQLHQAIQASQPALVVWNNPGGRLTSWLDDISVPVVECALPTNQWIAERLGAAACFEKPIDSDVLVEAIDRLDKVEHILVIDDERRFVQLVERILQADGHDFSISRAYGGEHGLAAMRTQRPDLVLLDLTMPDIDGLDVLRHMQQDADLASIPVFLLTGANFMEDTLKPFSNRIIIHERAGAHPYALLKYLSAIAGWQRVKEAAPV